MCKRVQVCDRRFVSYPHPFLSCIFETGIITFTLCTEGIVVFEIFAVSIDGESQIIFIRNGGIFCTASVFLAIIKVFMMAWAVRIFRVFQGTAEFLAGSVPVRKFSVLPHGKTGFTDRVSLGKKFGIFRITFV